MYIMPIRDMKDTTKTAEICEQTKEPIFVTKNGYGKLVVMSMETYEQKILLAELMQAKEQALKGETVDGKTLIEELKQQYAE